MKRALLLILAGLVAVVSCRDAATLNGTAALVTVQAGQVGVDQLRFSAALVADGGVVLAPTLRPTTPGDLLPSESKVRILLPDALAGQLLDVEVAGVRQGVDRTEGVGRLLVALGREVATTVSLQAQSTGCEGCAGCCSAGRCLDPGPASCGLNGSACVVCDLPDTDTCGADGRCHCGPTGPPCTAALGGDQCVNQVCQCGSGPACQAGQECLQRACQCTSASCAGCCLDNTCIITPSSSACGTGGQACLDCGGTPCSGGTCGTAVCNPGNCDGGCCSGGTCLAGRDQVACGATGLACTSCGTGSCTDAGVCTGGCGPDTCPMGCCQGGVCLPGTDAGACGTGGTSCAQCPTTCTNQACDAPCGPTTCPTGCCEQGVCRTGTDSAACGRDGGACVACSGATCNASGVCIGCSATTCTGGCCASGVCTPSGTTTCGTGGKACVSCLTPTTDRCTSGTCRCGGSAACGVGQVCDGGSCVCDPATCAGCCEGTTCQPGNTKQNCGKGGATCAKCSGGNGCTDAGVCG